MPLWRLPSPDDKKTCVFDVGAHEAKPLGHTWKTPIGNRGVYDPGGNAFLSQGLEPGQAGIENRARYKAAAHPL